jgi:mRNA-degrading endonuclease toxin of MazEF toxin-antitoxin module
MIFWAEITAAEGKGSEQQEMRPWLVVSRNQVHRLPICIAVPLSFKLQKGQSADFRGYRIRLPEAEVQRYATTGGVPQMQQGDSLALTEQVRVMAHQRLRGSPIARVTIAAMAAVEAGLKFVMELG